MTVSYFTDRCNKHIEMLLPCALKLGHDGMCTPIALPVSVTAPGGSEAETIRRRLNFATGLDPDRYPTKAEALAALDALTGRVEQLENALQEARAYVYNVAIEYRENWRGETASDVLGRVDAALASAGEPAAPEEPEAAGRED